MSADRIALLAVGGLACVCLVLLVVLVRLRAAWARTRDEVAALRSRLDRFADRDPRAAAGVTPPVEPVQYLITGLGADRPQPAESVRPDPAAFADIVLKETVVRAASLAHGVRRGLAPANRNRIRFEMKQEVRRARKQRRADLKAAQRDLHARHRSALTEEAS